MNYGILNSKKAKDLKSLIKDPANIKFRSFIKNVFLIEAELFHCLFSLSNLQPFPDFLPQTSPMSLHFQVDDLFFFNH